MSDTDKLRQQIVTILKRNQDEGFLRLALINIATLAQVWHEKKK